MDWDAQYELLKAGKAIPQAGPSYTVRNESNIDDDDMRPVLPGRDPEDEPERRRTNFILDEEETVTTPLERLTRHWMNERHAPDILPAQEDLLMNLLDHLRRQVRLWQTLSTRCSS